MFTRLLISLIFLLTVLVGMGITFPTNTLAGYFETPRYNGEILPITSPIVMRYRPHPVAALTSESQQRINAGGKFVNTTTITKGEIQQISRGDKIELIISINTIETLVKGEKKIKAAKSNSNSPN